MSEEQVTFIGGGNMGRALIAGLIARGVAPARLAVADPADAARAALAADFGIRTSADSAALASTADLIVLAVKPQALGEIVKPLAAVFAARRPVVISVAAGVRVAALAAWCGEHLAIVRAMPNRPALCGAGITGLYARPNVSQEARQRAESVLAAVGETVWVDSEDDLDVVTAVSGSGPAYFFLLAEHLAKAGAQLGLNPETAHRLAVATLYGAGRLAHDSDGDLARLRAEVTSRGGTTEAALREFAAAKFDGVVAAAVAAAAQRGRELAAEFS